MYGQGYVHSVVCEVNKLINGNSYRLNRLRFRIACEGSFCNARSLNCLGISCSNWYRFHRRKQHYAKNGLFCRCNNQRWEMNESVYPSNQSHAAVQPSYGNILAAILGSLLIISTLIGNSLVCINFYLFKELRTVCHYFVISLSAADILVALVAMPFWCALQVTSNQWLFSQELRIFWNCMDILCGSASIMNLAAVSIDRHAAITDPFSYQNVMTSVRAIGMIVFVWLYSLLVSGLRLASWPTKSSYMLFIALSSFFLPLFIMIVMYVKIYFVARKQAHLLRRGRSYAKDVKAAKTIALLIGLFVICWGPFFAIILCFAYDQSCPVPSSLFNVIKWMEYTSSCLNPIIYTFLDRSYRRAFRKLCKLVRKSRHQSNSSTTAGSQLRDGSSFTGSHQASDSVVDPRRKRTGSIIGACLGPSKDSTI